MIKNLKWNALVIMLLFTLQSFAQTKKTETSIGHSIQISLKPYQNIKIYIGTNYGNNRVLADSAILNEKSEGVFQSAKKLTPGIYFVVSPKFAILFDFLVDETQKFKIIADTTNLSNVTFIGSNENLICLDLYSCLFNHFALD